MRTQPRGTKEFMRWASCLIILCGLAGAFPGAARAQKMAANTTSQWDISFDYSYVRARPAGAGGSSSLQGGSASGAYYFHNCFGFVADFGGYKFTGQPAGLSANMYTYLFGPRYTMRRGSRFAPFAQALVGGGRLNASAGGIQAGENALAFSLGGGLDIGVTHSFAIRAGQAEYLMTRFANVAGAAVTQNNFRFSAGVVFRFGGH